MIGLALLGFGASGSALAVARRRVGFLHGREPAAFAIAAAFAALSFDPAYRLAATVPFDAFELIAVPRQMLYLALTWIVLGLPFFFAGAAVALAFLVAPDRIGRNPGFAFCAFAPLRRDLCTLVQQPKAHQQRPLAQTEIAVPP